MTTRFRSLTALAASTILITSMVAPAVAAPDREQGGPPEDLPSAAQPSEPAPGDDVHEDGGSDDNSAEDVDEKGRPGRHANPGKDDERDGPVGGGGSVNPSQENHTSHWETLHPDTTCEKIYDSDGVGSVTLDEDVAGVLIRNDGPPGETRTQIVTDPTAGTYVNTLWNDGLGNAILCTLEFQDDGTDDDGSDNGTDDNSTDDNGSDDNGSDDNSTDDESDNESDDVSTEDENVEDDATDNETTEDDNGTNDNDGTEDGVTEIGGIVIEAEDDTDENTSTEDTSTDDQSTQGDDDATDDDVQVMGVTVEQDDAELAHTGASTTLLLLLAALSLLAGGVLLRRRTSDELA